MQQFTVPVSCVVGPDKTWPRTHVHGKKKEVFKTLGPRNPNFTVRRLEISMKEELKKAQSVRKVQLQYVHVLAYQLLPLKISHCIMSTYQYNHNTVIPI